MTTMNYPQPPPEDDPELPVDHAAWRTEQVWRDEREYLDHNGVTRGDAPISGCQDQAHWQLRPNHLRYGWNLISYRDPRWGTQHDQLRKPRHARPFLRAVAEHERACHDCTQHRATARCVLLVGRVERLTRSAVTEILDSIGLPPVSAADYPGPVLPDPTALAVDRAADAAAEEDRIAGLPDLLPPDLRAAWIVAPPLIAETAGEWIDAGIRDAVVAQRWAAAGWDGDPYGAAHWRDECSTDPDVASAWADAVEGSPEDAAEWIRAGFSVTDALAWIEAGVVEPADALDRRQAGEGPTSR